MHKMKRTKNDINDTKQKDTAFVKEARRTTLVWRKKGFSTRCNFLLLTTFNTG